MKDTLIKLLNAYGAAGREGNVTDVIAGMVAPHCDEMRTDALGNLICIKKGKPEAGSAEGQARAFRSEAEDGRAQPGTQRSCGTGRKIMVCAHMDHIGFVVTDADEKGFLRVGNVGGIRKSASINRRVIFENGVNGVLSNELEDFSADDKRMENLFIDVGASSREEALSHVSIGDVAVYAPGAFELLNGIVAAPAMDDRAGCAIAVEAMKALSDCENEVAFVFSAQEEVGLRGARAAAYSVDPEIGVSLDVTLSGDTPKGPKIAVKLGAGPCVKLRDSSLVASPKVVRGLEAAAGRLGIPVQREVLTMGGNDAGAMQLSRAGVLAGTISVACRYVHSASEAVSLPDLERAAALLVEFLQNPLCE